MAPTMRSSKTDSKNKNKEHNMSPLKLDNKIPLLLPNTTLPTKLPVQHSTYDTSKSDGMDLLMKALQEHKIICQRNKQKLQDFELRYNSLSSTFTSFTSDYNDGVTIMTMMRTMKTMMTIIK